MNISLRNFWRLKMAEVIQSVFLTPALSIARLGGGTTPQVAYRWAQSPNPRSSGETVAVGDWSIQVEADGSVTPFMPTELKFRDGALIRPVCPFIEVWARMGEPGSAPDAWHEAPLTPAILAAQGVALADVAFRVTAINSKVARRMRNPDLRFGTFPPIEVRANDNRSTPLLAVSPPGVAGPMIPAGRNIPLGSVQVMRSTPQPAPGSTPWSDAVNVEVLRLRFTPARGRVYGPRQAAQANPTPWGGNAVPVDPAQAFLDPQAGWFGIIPNPPDAPGDTYDGADVSNNASLGVVDDTCEARIEVLFALPQQGGRVASASTTVFVAPPDFAPDRRPFLSLADELNDRTGDAVARNVALSAAERDVWVEDLFERIYETVALFNVDLWRRRAASLSGTQLAAATIPGDNTPGATRAMGGRDALRNREYALAAPSAVDPLPLTGHARMRHRALSDLQALRDFVQQHHGRLTALVRPPFAVLPSENANTTTMAMPPFMRNSNALPLTLAAWQYDLLIQWATDVQNSAGPIGGLPAAAAPAPLSAAAATRREEVLRNLGAGAPP
jgi:hypothetical protein